jgi:hypothetical protein
MRGARQMRRLSCAQAGLIGGNRVNAANLYHYSSGARNRICLSHVAKPLINSVQGCANYGDSSRAFLGFKSLRLRKR